MPINPADFEFVSKLIREESAIVLDKGKEYLVESRLTPLAKQFEMNSLEELVAALKNKPDPKLKRFVVEALTTNETSFFRDISPFEALKSNVIPELLKKRSDKKELNIWCAASSTGQEPYSVAMILRENFPETKNWRINFLATDISEEILAKARSGIFSQMEVNRGLPVTYLVKYFEKNGQAWIIKPEIREMIKFEKLNLIKPFNLVSNVDIVMIRNVLIYFDTEVKKEILGKIKRLLRPGGYMFLGAAETTLNLDEGFERKVVGKTSCYQVKGHGT